MTDKTESRKATRSFWKKLFLAGLFIFGLLVLLAWICLFRNVPIEISKETTYITEPLTSDGKRVDYFRAIELETYPPNMKTDENGFRMIIREIGVSQESKDRAWAVSQIHKKLGLDPSVKPTMTFQSPDKFLENHVECLTEVPEERRYEKQEKLTENLERPWTLDEMMANWIENNSAALDIIAEAAASPSFAVPLVRENEDELLSVIELHEILRIQDFARGLEARANFRIANGELDKAIDDILACKNLGRSTTHNAFTITFLVGFTTEVIADEIGIAGNADHQPTEIQLQRLLDIYTDTSNKKLSNRINPKETIKQERYATLDLVQHIAHNSHFDTNEYSASDHKRVWLWLLSHLGKDWNIVMETVNYLYDHPEVTMTLSPEKALSLNALLLPNSRSEIMGNALTRMLMLPTAAIFETCNRLKCNDRLKVITLAMLIHEKQRGTLPPAWTVDKDGKPLHSWRVLLLPYLGKEAKKLHAKIRLDEPWDSEHNRQFHKAAIPFYQCPSASLEPGQTIYSVVVGEKTAFQGGKGKKLTSFGPNSANMILLLEQQTPACWMDPASDLTENNIEDILNQDTIHPGMIATGLRNGGIKHMSVPIELEKFRQGLEGTADDWNSED